ncbi:MAG: DUF2705 family protein [Oscillospiraceae bacterium]|nr:DUF2705 family protein [Oscillospiraceae bacterium]
MKENKLNFLFMIFAMVVQSIFLNTACLNNYNFTFAFGLSEIHFENPSLCINILCIVLPQIFILLFYSGKTYDIIHGYGKMLVIRSYSKKSIILNQFLKTVGALFFITIIQFAVSWIIQKKPVESTDYLDIIKCTVLYLAGMIFIVQVEQLLEFWFEHNISCLITILYLYVSYVIVCIVKVGFLKYMLPSVLVFGVNNGSIKDDNSYIYSLIMLIFVNIMILLVKIFKMKKSDIF